MALGPVLKRVGWLAVLAGIAAELPTTVLMATELVPTWLALGLDVAVGTFIECAIIAAWFKREFGREPGAGLDFDAANRNYSRLIRINLLLGIVSVIAMLACCVGVGVVGLLFAAIPIAVFEDRGVVESIREAWRRTEGRRVPLAVATVVVMVPDLVLTLASTAVQMGLEARAAPAEVIAVVEVGGGLLGSVFGTLPLLFQLVIWLATRPVAHSDAAPPRTA